MKHRKKLIEVALPLEAINKASAREKSIRHGHPSTLHLWWARRPLAAARAVIFAQMVDDPSAVPELYPTKEQQDAKRQELFKLIEQLVQWESTTNEELLARARAEIWESWKRACADNADHPRAHEIFDPQKLPAFHDPFAGGGSLPLEAQRLGLEAYASDLNPVAVLINKAMIEIPPRFAGMPPVHPASRTHDTELKSSRALSRADRGADVSGPCQRSVSARCSAAAERNVRDTLAEASKDSRSPMSYSLFARDWKGAQGLAEDVRYYGQWMRDEAEKRIGHLYPPVEITPELAQDRPDLQPLVGHKLTVIAWLWARTVKSPNPAFAHVDVPLASTFVLSNKPGKEAYVEVVRKDYNLSSDAGSSPYCFVVRVAGAPGFTREGFEQAKKGTKLARGAFRCVMSGVPMEGDYIKAEGKAGRMGARLMAIVAEGNRGRVYLPPTPEHEAAAQQAKPVWKPEGEIAKRMTGGNCTPYGLTTWGDLFTPRQLVALTTFSDLVGEAIERVRRDARAAGLPDDGKPLRDGGTGATAYAEAVGVYLAFAVDRCADYWSSLGRWQHANQQLSNLFSRQAVPMVWDYPEANPFSEKGGSFRNLFDWTVQSIPNIGFWRQGTTEQADAADQRLSNSRLISTDPPYYDNVGYADLSDFFYVWLRRSLRAVFPDLFATLATPKAEELIANPYRHGSKEKAEKFFLDGMTQAMHRLAVQAHPAFPVTIYYAYKQRESEASTQDMELRESEEDLRSEFFSQAAASTGWETFLDALIRAGFAITGTWPIRTELSNRMLGSGTNALASSIVIVCRKRPENAPVATRREFVTALKNELPAALRQLQQGNIAPVDFAQAAIGPGMTIYTRYAQVVDVQGKPVGVREALSLINQTLTEVLSEQEDEFDADTRWAIAWFEEHGFDEGEFGKAEILSKAKVTSVAGLVEAGIVRSKGGKVRLLRPEELPKNWDPTEDRRLTVWEMTHHLLRVYFHDKAGDEATAALLRKLGSRGEIARELAYRLYDICEKKKRSQEGQAYNALVLGWPEIARLAQRAPAPEQLVLAD